MPSSLGRPGLCYCLQPYYFQSWSLNIDEKCMEEKFPSLSMQCKYNPYCGSPTCYYAANRKTQNYSGPLTHIGLNMALITLYLTKFLVALLKGRNKDNSTEI